MSSTRARSSDDCIPGNVAAAIRAGFGVDDLAAAGVSYERQFRALQAANDLAFLPWLRLLARRMGTVR